jgi:HK97 family phage prohead protease
MKGLLEIKRNGLGGVKDVDLKNRVVTGYLSSFDNVDHSGDIITKGAYAKTLKERRDKIMFLNQHRWDQPHGKFAILQEDNKGLYFESEPLINTSYSEDTLKLYDAGIITDHSVGFVAITKETKGENRILKELKLYEGSNVTMGDNSETPFTGFKSLTISETNDKIGIILKFFKAGTVTDDTFQLLEIALKDLQKHAYEIGLNTKKEVIKIEPSAVDIINAYLSK